METVDMNVVDDAQEQRTEPVLEESQKGFYKSQKEVDRAFALRLAAERKKWEREQLGAEPLESGEESPELEQSEAPAGEEMEPDAGEMDLMEQKRFLMRVVEAEGEIKREDPYFDMEQEIRRNPMFALMIANGYDPRRVYEFFYPIRARGNLKKAVEREVMDRIRLRNRRPATMASPNAAMSIRDVARMSDEEIGRIDARVKRGERVRL
jgi:hypothetical protein